MADHGSFQDTAPAKFLAGVLGSAVSLAFMGGPWVQRLLMAVGGIALSYFGTPPAAGFFHMADAQGLVGFLLGLFSMAFVTKAYEVINGVNGTDIGKAVGNRIKKLLGK